MFRFRAIVNPAPKILSLFYASMRNCPMLRRMKCSKKMCILVMVFWEDSFYCEPPVLTKVMHPTPSLAGASREQRGRCSFAWRLHQGAIDQHLRAQLVQHPAIHTNLLPSTHIEAGDGAVKEREHLERYCLPGRALTIANCQPVASRNWHPQIETEANQHLGGLRCSFPSAHVF